MATTVLSNLPSENNPDSASKTLLYFNDYASAGQEYAAADVDATVGFMKNKGFGDQASLITAMILLKQAKIDSIPVWKLIETLSGLETIQLSALVGEILNSNRIPTSSLGFRVAEVRNEFQTRNILP
jgi:hypothetical protein